MTRVLHQQRSTLHQMPQRAGSRSFLQTADCQLPTQNSRLHNAFTLVELLIVLAIIAVVTALGIPLFGVLTGARSVEAGRNLVAATLGQARTVAVNEGKYAGVMFFVDPATERTAMSIVIVTDPASSVIEDPDPYDKYKAFVPEEPYYSGKGEIPEAVGKRGDRVISLASDADATFRGPLYDPQGSPKPPLVSDYLKLFGNYRPTVRVYRNLVSKKERVIKDEAGLRPPRNGPYGYAGSAPASVNQFTPGATKPNDTNDHPDYESTDGPFANDLWGAEDQTAVTRYSTGEMTVLPRGVGAQVLIQPIVTSSTPALTQRYVRTGVVMFDPQGRLVIRNFSLESSNTLGQYLQLRPDTTARNIISGIGLAIYDTQNFKGQQFAENDYIYSTAAYAIDAPTNPALINGDVATSPTAQAAKETWLDTNATPLIINRYTGSMSEAE